MTTNRLIEQDIFRRELLSRKYEKLINVFYKEKNVDKQTKIQKAIDKRGKELNKFDILIRNKTADIERIKRAKHQLKEK